MAGKRLGLFPVHLTVDNPHSNRALGYKQPHVFPLQKKGKTSGAGDGLCLTLFTCYFFRKEVFATAEAIVAVTKGKF